MTLGIIGIFIAIFAFSFLLETPRQYVVSAGITGAVGGAVYLVCIHYNMNIVLASFLSALAAAVLSHIFARIVKAPVTVFLIAGILPTVPGSGMYRIVYHMIEGSQSRTLYYLIQTLQIAGVIALAIFIVDTFFRIIKKREKVQEPS